MKRPAPQAYLLRLWFEGGRDPDRPGAWRFSLEAAHTGTRRGFADFEALVSFLAAQLALSDEDPNSASDWRQYGKRTEI